MTRVLVVGDSAFMRTVLTEELSRHPDIEVVGTAVDPYVARDKILSLQPDVITLDIETPRMDGLSFLARLMRHHPIPVVIVSSLAPESAEMAMRALELGAVEIVNKPGCSFATPGPRLVRAIRAASCARVQRLQLPATSSLGPAAGGDAAGAASAARVTSTRQAPPEVVAIGASTGGTRALEVILRALPQDTPGIIVVQHLPEALTPTFAERLNQSCALEVREAGDGDLVIPGVVLIAPGNRHVMLQRNGARYQVRLEDGPLVHHQRPAVDVLFESLARTAGDDTIGALLTGMGVDGAAGLLAMRQAGAFTIAEAEETCIVFGMSREAIRVGAAEAVLRLEDIAGAIVSGVVRRRRAG